MSFYQTDSNQYATNRTRVWRSLWLHTAGFVLIVVVLSALTETFLARLDAGLPKKVPGLVEKLEQWRQNKSQYDLIFIGDSRTYLGIAPGYIERESGLSGFNLGFWANWLPTQVALLRAMSKDVPKDNVIVWSIAHDTFIRRPGEVNTIFPLGLANALSLWRQGVALSDLVENVLRFTPGLSLFVARDRLRAEVNKFLSNDKVNAQPDESVFRQAVAEGVNPLSTFAELPVIASDAITAVDFYTRDGGLIRQELAGDYFRQRQFEAARDLAPVESFSPDPVYLELFMSTVRWLKERRVPFIINEMELAPYHYVRGRGGEAFRAFMKSLRADLENQGVFYSRVPFERYPDRYYFDFTHLNHDGVRAYATDFAAACGGHLKSMKEEAANSAVQ